MENVIERMIELGGELTIERESQKSVSYTNNGVRVYYDDYNEEIKVVGDEHGGIGVTEDYLHDMIAIVRAISKEFHKSNQQRPKEVIIFKGLFFFFD